MRHAISSESGSTPVKAVVIVAGAILFAAVVLMFGAKRENERRARDLQTSNAKLTQVLAKQEEELKSLRVQVGEIERMRRENAEIHKLRAESAELGKLRPENQRLRAETLQLQSRVLQLQRESAAQLQEQQEGERARLEAANLALRFIKPADRATIQRQNCVANLKQLEGAKRQWAIDNRKSARDVPKLSDLVGARLYLKLEPTCPLGGRYTINAVNANPTCSHSGHAL